MRQDELTTRAAAALSAAERLARQASHQAVEVPHIGLALISENDGLVGPLLAKLGVAHDDSTQSAKMPRLLPQDLQAQRD